MQSLKQFNGNLKKQQLIFLLLAVVLVWVLFRLILGFFLLEAIKEGESGVANTLLILRANPNARNFISNDKTALMIASANGQISIVQALIHAGATVNLQDEDGRTALDYALCNFQIEVASILLDAGADPNLKDYLGYTPLCTAVQLLPAYPDTIKKIIQKGADVNTRMMDGECPLHRATFQENKELIALLLSAGADVNAQIFWDGREYPKDTGRYPEFTTKYNGKTALMLAASHGRIDLVQLLLNYNPDIDAKDKDGKTAAKIAEEHNFTGIVELLKQASSAKKNKR